MSKLVFDIETAGEDFDNLDKKTKEVMTKWITESAENENDYEQKLKYVKERMGFSPLTGEIVAIGVLDVEKDKGVVYFQAPEKNVENYEKGNHSFKKMTEPEMLKHFWQGIDNYDEVVSFNGRGFDVPFIMVRSAIHNIGASQNLMSNRYLSSQRQKTKHVDLADELTFYGAVRRKEGLHLWCRAFGITSPKEGEITGEDVGKMFGEGEYKKIAEYNAKDLEATKKLYEYWDKYLRF